MKKGALLRITKVYNRIVDKGTPRPVSGPVGLEGLCTSGDVWDVGKLNSSIGAVRAVYAELVGTHPSAD